MIDSKMFKFVVVCILLLLIVSKIPVHHTDISQVHTFDGREMTIDYRIIVGMNEDDRPELDGIISRTFGEIDRIYNKWNPHSEVSKLNRLRAHEVAAISPELETFLQMTAEMVNLSGGRFDPTIEPLQQIWKDHLELGKIPSQQVIQDILPVVGWDKLHFGRGEFYKDHDMTSFDLGGIAKGYCVDLLLERIVAAGFDNVLVEWGGEIRAHGRHPDERPWRVFVGRFDDGDPQHAITHLGLTNQAIATSGDYLQNWSVVEDGAETVYYHIIDPLTAQPLSSTMASVASATVVAPTCVQADALATVAMMHPSLAVARAWADRISQQNPAIKFWLISREEQ